MLYIVTEAFFSAFLLSYTETYFSSHTSTHVQHLDDLQTQLAFLLQNSLQSTKNFQIKVVVLFLAQNHQQRRKKFVQWALIETGTTMYVGGNIREDDKKKIMPGI